AEGGTRRSTGNGGLRFANPPYAGSSRLLAVGLQPRVDQRNGGVDDGVAQPLLLGDELHQLVGALDVGDAVVEGARGGGRAHQALGGGGVFFERHEVARRGAELDAQVVDEIVDRARGLDVGVHRLLRGAHAV